MGFNNEDNSYQSQEFEKSMKKMLLKIKAIKVKFYSGDRQRYKFYRNKVPLLSCISKGNYYHTYFGLNSSNIRKNWEGINLLINQKKKKSDKVITSLKHLNNDSITSDPTEILNILNKHFASIGQTLASKIAHSEEFSQYLRRLLFSESFAFNQVLPGEAEVESLFL